MNYFNTLKDCKAANPNANWFYYDRKGIGGKTRWYASRRLLKRAQEKLANFGYSVEAARKQGLTTIEM